MRSDKTLQRLHFKILACISSHEISTYETFVLQSLGTAAESYYIKPEEKAKKRLRREQFLTSHIVGWFFFIRYGERVRYYLIPIIISMSAESEASNSSSLTLTEYLLERSATSASAKSAKLFFKTTMVSVKSKLSALPTAVTL